MTELVEHSFPPRPGYPNVFELTTIPNEIWIGDHCNGFLPDRTNAVFNYVSAMAKQPTTVHYCQVFDESVKSKYPNLNFKFRMFNPMWQAFENYTAKPDHEFKNFVCSFNGSPHASRKLLTAGLHKFGWFNPTYCSKNFIASRNEIDGEIQNHCPAELEPIYRKFILSDRPDADQFYNTSSGFGFVRQDHGSNVKGLQNKLTQSFVHVVSETVGHSYYPYVTEKFLYSVVTRGLFVAYTQPGWHKHLAQYYGFKPYTRLFNYTFDSIESPVVRLVELFSMLSKFSKLSEYDCHDLYLMEQDTINYNYNHYFTKGYLKVLHDQLQ
jgi:hypothetical protein